MDYYTGVLRKYAVFEGRASRKEFWMFALFSIIIMIVLGLVGNIIHLPFLLIIYDLAVLLPTLGVAIRRLHDTNRTGWWFLIFLVPIIGAIILIVFYAIDSQPGANKYGPNPKGVAGIPTSTPTQTPTQTM